MGYDEIMLVVAVLVPLAVMVAAVLLERFEARAVGTATPTAPRASRVVADTPAAAAAPVGAERHLHAVPAAVSEPDDDAPDDDAPGHDAPRRPLLDPDTIRLPRAS